MVKWVTVRRTKIAEKSTIGFVPGKVGEGKVIGHIELPKSMNEDAALKWIEKHGIAEAKERWPGIKWDEMG